MYNISILLISYVPVIIGKHLPDVVLFGKFTKKLFFLSSITNIDANCDKGINIKCCLRKIAIVFIVCA